MTRYHKTCICTYQLGFLDGGSHQAQWINQALFGPQAVEQSIEEESLPISDY